jgi:hypothetical protein
VGSLNEKNRDFHLFGDTNSDLYLFGEKMKIPCVIPFSNNLTE